MEKIILDIAKELLAVSIGFAGLIFTSLSILMTLSDSNWKIKKLKKSTQFKNFVSFNTNTAISFIILFAVSVMLLMLNEVLTDKSVLGYILYAYIAYLLYLAFCVVFISYKYKQVIFLMLDNSKPTVSTHEESDND